MSNERAIGLKDIRNKLKDLLEILWTYAHTFLVKQPINEAHIKINLFSYLDNGVIPLELAPLEAPDSAAPELERRVLEEDCNTEEEVEEEEDD